MRLRTIRVSRLVCLTALALSLPFSSARAEVADSGGYRPHFQGYGADTRGGRGGAVLKVTHLADTTDPASPSWNGSLRKALTATGPRFVIFEVSGTISLVSDILITSPFLTVAGQTAPSPGILIRNRSIYVDTNDVVFQHLRLRMGDSACVNDCAAGGSAVLYIRNNAYNVVLDHLSISWGTQGGIGINAWSGNDPREIAILDSIVAENLGKPTNPYGFGTLFMPSPDGTATFARNLHAHNGNRNPWIGPGWRFSGYNNVAYNASSVARDEGTLGFLQVMGGYPSGGAYDAVWVSNVSLAGLDTHADGKAVKIDMRAGEVGWGHRLFMADNVGPYQTAANQWAGATFKDAATQSLVRASSLPAWYVNFGHEVIPTEDVLSYVLANAGARPLDRDAVDRRVVQDVRNKTGRRITTPAQVGGYPALAQVRRPLAVPAEPHAVVDAAGRTRIEAWLEAFARALEPARSRALSAPGNLRFVE